MSQLGKLLLLRKEATCFSLGAPHHFSAFALANPALWAMKIVFTPFKQLPYIDLKVVSHYMGTIWKTAIPQKTHCVKPQLLAM